MYQIVIFQMLIICDRTVALLAGKNNSVHSGIKWINTIHATRSLPELRCDARVNWAMPMSDFKCENCGKFCPESERAPLPVVTRLLFAVSQLILAAMFGWSFELCGKCVRQRYVLSGLVITGFLVLLLF